MNAAIIFLILTALMVTGMPVSIALGLTVLSFLFGFTDVPLESVALKLFTGIEKFEIMAIPFFILAGNFLTHGGVARRMINFATAMVGHWHGGLGLGGVVACALFAAVSGSSPATVVAIGSILLPAMAKAGFPKRFGAGVIATSGALGILIPPSIVMVMYAVATNTSVGALFMAGVVPGLLLAMVLGGVTWWRARKNNYPRLPKATWGERWVAFRKSFWGLFLIVVVMGGIYSGIFTPTEAAAMSAVYAFIVAVFVYKDMGLKDVSRVLLSSANMSAMLLYIITNAALFSFIMTNENIPQAMADWMLGNGLGVISFLLAVNVILLLAGNPHGGEHLKDLLVGQILWVTPDQLWGVAALSAAVLAVWFGAQRWLGQAGFYLVFAVAVTASVQLVGVYLVFSSLIMPALAVRRAPRR